MGVEYMLKIASFSLQYEQTFVRCDWRDFDSEIYISKYLQLGLFLTGEHYIYDRDAGAFVDPVPLNPKIGAIQLILRYTCVQLLNEGALLRGVDSYDGSKRAFTAGVNYFVNKNVKCQANFMYETYDFRMHSTREIMGFGIRVQVLF